MRSGHYYLGTACCMLLLAVLLSNPPQVTAACTGDAPILGGLTLSCIDDFWQSVGSVVLTNCSSGRINGPTIINGNLTMDYRSLLTYEPPSLSSAPLIIVKGCAFFNQSYIRINLTREVNKELVYAQDRKQKNHWLYIMPLETSCPSMDVNTLNFQSEIHWSYGVAINSTVISSTKTKITYLTVEPGHSAIQIGLLGGSPIGSQAWFSALFAVLAVCVVIIIVGKLIQCLTNRSVDRKIAKLGNDINGDESTVSLLDDTE